MEAATSRDLNKKKKKQLLKSVMYPGDTGQKSNYDHFESNMSIPLFIYPLREPCAGSFLEHHELLFAHICWRKHTGVCLLLSPDTASCDNDKPHMHREPDPQH